MGCAYSVSVNRFDRLCCKASAYFLLIIMQKCSVVAALVLLCISAVRVDRFVNFYGDE